MAGTAILWLRQDLRLADQAALHSALAGGHAVVPVFCWHPKDHGAWPPGSASRVVLHHTLAALDSALRRCGSRLVLRRGPAVRTLIELAQECGAAELHYTRCYEPAARELEQRVARELEAAGVMVRAHGGALLVEPEALRTGAGGPYQVFTPFHRAWLRSVGAAPPLPEPEHLPAPAVWPAGLALAELKLLPQHAWAEGITAAHSAGEQAAQAQLVRFLDTAVADYASARDFPAVAGTSSLSPALHWGTLSPRQAWAAALERRAGLASAEQAGVDAWLRQLAWREFAYHMLWHFPHTPEQPLRVQYAGLPWRDDAAQLACWQRGATGYPLVDAGLRELWQTGVMHNRVRMVAASFLVKHLLLPWQAGARWFWDTLADADLANNSFGWQWCAGCGADAAPFFRIFNPVLQGAKFDAEGAYVRRWLPELAALPARHLHAPWAAPPEVLRQAGVELGRNYPQPLVEHAAARARALAAMRELGPARGPASP